MMMFVLKEPSTSIQKSKKQERCLNCVESKERANNAKIDKMFALDRRQKELFARLERKQSL